jgi:LemA protein
MSKKIISLGVVAVVVLVLLGGGCSTYNSMVTAEENVAQSWAAVENQYQRRADLVPNLVETVKGYAKHESETYETVTKARAGLSDAYNAVNEASGTEASQSQDASTQYLQAQDQLKSALNVYVNAVKEAYPELKANEQFLNLQAQLEGTENRISTERKRYTEVVNEYNIKIKRFPAYIVANLCGFDAKPQFKAEEGAQKAPKIEF